MECRMTAAFHLGTDMQKQILWGVLVGMGMAMVCGCGADTSKAATPEEKKSFAGGEMPADARAKFQDSQKQNAQRIADIAAKARANAGGQ